MKGSHLALVSACLLAGCAAFPARKTEFAAGSVLVLPPRDVVQNGDEHEAGAGTGERLGEAVVTRLKGTPFTPMTTSAVGFDNAKVADKDKALAEARRLGSNYCLQLVLGEFRDAAAMTFRGDFVTLEAGVMWAVADGEEVWRITEPVVREKGNLGGCTGLIDGLAKEVANSIAK